MSCYLYSERDRPDLAGFGKRSVSPSPPRRTQWPWEGCALEQQTHESEVTSQPGSVTCEVSIGKYPELVPSDWTKCYTGSQLHELSCSFVERSLLWNATVVKMLEGRNVTLCLLRLPVALAVGRILLAFAEALSLFSAQATALGRLSQRNTRVKLKSKPNRAWWVAQF